jgi:toxin ParE1/3/4
MRSRRVVFSREAESQLEALHRYVTEDSGAERADALIGRIIAFCRNLASFPERGTLRQDLRPNLRTIGFRRRATIAFTVRDDEVAILGVFYGGQDYESAFLDPDG